MVCEAPRGMGAAHLTVYEVWRSRRSRAHEAAVFAVASVETNDSNKSRMTRHIMLNCTWKMMVSASSNWSTFLFRGSLRPQIALRMVWIRGMPRRRQRTMATRTSWKV